MDVLRKVVRLAAIVRAALMGSEQVDGIEVMGRPKFRDAVREALKALHERDQPVWTSVTRHIGRVIEGPTASVVTAHPPFVLISKADAESKMHLAGVLAHMACGCEIYREYEASAAGGIVSAKLYAGPDAQVRCDRAYRECLAVLTGQGNGSPSSS